MNSWVTLLPFSFIISGFKYEIALAHFWTEAKEYLNLYVHKSPKEYLTTVRMEQAKKMLSTHRYKIKEVGKFVGYKNQLHFSSEFKKYTGKSPLQYSKSNED